MTRLSLTLLATLTACGDVSVGCPAGTTQEGDCRATDSGALGAMGPSRSGTAESSSARPTHPVSTS